MKECSHCKVLQPLTEFNVRKHNGVPLGKCKACANEYSKAHYKQNAAKHNLRRLINNRRYRKRNQEIARTAKSKPCSDCGIQYPWYVMQFDHLRDKEFDIANGHGHVTEAKLKNEIAKCDVVCANCHMERSHHRRQFRV